MTHLSVKFICAAILIMSSNIASAQPLTYELLDDIAEFKPGPGIEAAQNNCVACHSADYINTQPPALGHDHWAAVVKKMKNAYGASIDDTDMTAIVDYLAATY